MIGLHEQPAYVIVSQPLNSECWNEKKIKSDIEDGDIQKKIDALKELIFTVAGGHKLSRDILIYVIRFLIPIENKFVKKLLLLFWEVFPKYQSDGKLIQEMILVCDAYRKDLQHPNEYIRGSILRFLCKLKEPELIEPIMPAVRQCLEHKTPYQFLPSISKILIHRNFDYLVPDAPELLERFLDVESDSSCQRNAYMMLIECDQQNRAISYLRTKVNSVLAFNDVLQLSIIELVYKVAVESEDKSAYLPYLYELLCSDSSAVKYSAANTLLSLSDAQTAFEYAVRCYVNLIIKERDNNIRLTVVDRLVAIHGLKKYDWLFHTLLLDLLSVLDTGTSDSIIDLELARKIIELVNELLPPELTVSAIDFIKKEVLRVQKRYLTVSEKKKISGSNKEIVEYHRLIVKFIKYILERNLDIHDSIIPILISNISFSHFSVAQEVLNIIRMIVCTFPKSREYAFNELSKILKSLNDPNVFRASLWITISCISRQDQIDTLFSLIDSSITQNAMEPAEKFEFGKQNVTVGPDGSYLSTIDNVSERSNIPILNKFICDNNSHVCSVVATMFCKVVGLIEKFGVYDATDSNKLIAKIINVLIKMIYVYEKKFNDLQNIDIQRTMAVVNMLISKNPKSMCSFLEESQKITFDYLEAKYKDRHKELVVEVKGTVAEGQEWKISFSSIVEPTKTKQPKNIYNQSLLEATGKLQKPDSFLVGNKVIALTGLSDAVYAEAYVRVVNFDIFFDVLVVNQTGDYLQNLTLDMRTKGDFRVLVKDPPISLDSLKFANISTCLRLTSSENHVVYGTITYDTSGKERDSFCVILDEIVLDLTETVQTTKCSPDAFQKMWAEFEWENKVIVAFQLVSFNYFLEKITSESRMTLISDSVDEDCKYLVVNLYSKNMFNDEALANISVEKDADTNQIVGQIRIRAKTQTIALTLGNKLAEILKKN
ncbi:Coatomer subunit beta [Thelohanellus kitauei]|uniref:Coatomer subunit beta n=1 Tax=Thelohanellus kitauei TaxID=669202 RepID=A0A0C2MVX2_THEKT|nr:Coatomer subunit beta [Thelohanellus kitauei]